jgi:tRNA(Ile)-lysidine synthase TilS/MesJ
MTETKIITEKEVRKIAKEESLKIITKEMNQLRDEIRKQGDILARLERMLLGESGVDENETLKWRANFAYQYARLNTEKKIIERAEPALEWFEDMSECEKGEKESKLETLGKLIVTSRHIGWLFTVLGITTFLNALPLLEEFIKWIVNLTK